jgi:hypothetical protein
MDTSANPLVLALAALDRLEPAEKAAEQAADWQEMRQAVLRAMQEREVFLTTVGAAVGLIDVMDDYNDALEAGEEEKAAELADACADAEDVLIDALNQVHDLLGPEEEVSDDARLLEALDRFAEEEDGDPRP